MQWLQLLSASEVADREIITYRGRPSSRNADHDHADNQQVLVSCLEESLLGSM